MSSKGDVGTDTSSGSSNAIVISSNDIANDGDSPAIEITIADADDCADAALHHTTRRKTAIAARKNWKRAASAASKAAHAKRAVGKVKLENKIGTNARDLDDDDALKIIALAVQRALRDFGNLPSEDDSKVVGKSDSPVRAHVRGASTADGDSSNQRGGGETPEQPTLDRPHSQAGKLRGEGSTGEAEGGPNDLGREAGQSTASTGTGSPSRTPSQRNPPKLEGKILSRNVLEFAETSDYAVRQPRFECGRSFDHQFKRIRAAFGINEVQYNAGLGLQNNRTQSNFSVIASRDASGKSRSFFFLSPDQRFMLKACTRKDVETTGQFVSPYLTHVESFVPVDEKTGKKKKGSCSTTLLPRVLGMYYLRFSDRRVPSVVLAAQVNFFAAAYQIHKKFDLKGSTWGRMASDKERKKKSPVFKDLDWMEQGRRLRFPSKEDMVKVSSQLRSDTELLAEHGLIDYSLLVGVHEMDKTKLAAYDQQSEPFRVIRTKNEDAMEIYYFGIVDVLTPYGYRKKSETFMTGTMMCCRDVSCQRPDVYQKRFIKFCDDEVLAFEENTPSKGSSTSLPHMDEDSVEEEQTAQQEKIDSKKDNE